MFCSGARCAACVQSRPVLRLPCHCHVDINPKYVHAGAGLCGVPAVGKCGAAILQVGVTAQGKIFASPSPCMQFLEIMCMPCPPLRRHM